MGDCEGVALAAPESTVKYHPNNTSILTLSFESRQKTVPDGQFDWGGSLLKCNDGVQWFPQVGRQSTVEYKRIRELNCESDRTIRYESRG